MTDRESCNEYGTVHIRCSSKDIVEYTDIKKEYMLFRENRNNRGKWWIFASIMCTYQNRTLSAAPPGRRAETCWSGA